jgi:hypothetical protein
LTAARRADLTAAAVYLLLALWTTGHLWRDPSHRVARVNPGDNTLFEWMLAYGARVVQGQNPFFTQAMNAPNGVNLIANTSVPGLSIPLAPVTLLFGPGVSFAVLLTLAMSLTAFGWYVVFSRHLVTSRLAAGAGAGVCGFAPAMVAHAGGQPNLVAQFALPFVALATLKLPVAPVKAGAALGLLLVYQALVNEEVLLIAALALGLFVVVYAACDKARARRDARRFLTGLGLAAFIAGALLAYPLYRQFFGVQAYRGLPFPPGQYSNDLLALVTPPRQSLAGAVSQASTRLTRSPNEDDAAFGVPLVALAGISALWLWRRSPLVRAAAVVGVVFAVLSLGPVLRWHGHPSTYPGPFALVGRVPPMDLAVPARLTMATVPVLGALLALGWQRAFRVRRHQRATRLLAAGAVAVALVPLLPTPVPVSGRRPMPAFLASGAWRQYVPAGRTIVPVPLPSYRTPDPLYWQAEARLAYPLPRGYFLGPRGADDPRAQFGAPARQMSSTLYRISMLPWRPVDPSELDTPLTQWRRDRLAGTIAPFTRSDRAGARADLRYWRAAIVILAPPQHNEQTLRKRTTELLGIDPQWTGGVWLWDVRRLTG